MTRSRSWWKTLIGVVLTGLMLFPLYWMINVSLTQPTDLRRDPPNLFPLNPTFDGYTTVINAAASMNCRQPRSPPWPRRRPRAPPSQRAPSGLR